MPSRVSNDRLGELQAELGRINAKLDDFKVIEYEKTGSKLWDKLGTRIRGAKDAAQSDVNGFVAKGDLGKAQMAYGA